MRMPKDSKEIPLSMSNFDHAIDSGLDSALRKGGVFGRHAAWEFNGLVWFSDGQFHEEVWRYRAYQETISAATLDDLMAKVNDKWGWA